MQEIANENAAVVRRISKRSDQPKIESNSCARLQMLDFQFGLYQVVVPLSFLRSNQPCFIVMFILFHLLSLTLHVNGSSNAMFDKLATPKGVVSWQKRNTRVRLATKIGIELAIMQSGILMRYNARLPPPFKC